MAALVLADTPWPRSGGDRQNSGNTRALGPVRGRVRWSRALPGPAPHFAGVIVGADGELWISAGGHLTRLGRTGRRVWSRRMAAGKRGVCSAALALADGSVVVTVPGQGALRVGDGGRVQRLGGVAAARDDSGPSPNLTPDGRLVLTSMGGEVSLLGPGRACGELGSFGYDIVPPPLYPDGSAAVSGYAGKGFCRVGLDGSLRFRTKFRDPDLVATVNRRQHAAVGALNDKASMLFGPGGRALGSWPHAAVFATLGHDWLALGAARVARLGPDGRERWGRRLAPSIGSSWGARGPVVDAASRIYVPYARGVLALDAASGELLFRCPLGATPKALAPAGDGLLVVVCADTVHAIG